MTLLITLKTLFNIKTKFYTTLFANVKNVRLSM